MKKLSRAHTQITRNIVCLHILCLRSAHGFSDTDMESLIGQLRREEDNMVRHRGLVPGTENQTFEMTIPSSLRTYYRRVMAPLNNASVTRNIFYIYYKNKV